MRLSEMKPGQIGTVAAIRTQGALERRIMNMGITKGCTILVRKMAPLGDPMEIQVRGYELSLRKNECAVIEMAEEKERNALPVSAREGVKA